MDFLAVLGCDTHFKSDSIHARWWRYLAYVNTLYPMSVAGSMSLDLFTLGLQTCTAVARSPLRYLGFSCCGNVLHNFCSVSFSPLL